MSTRFFEGALRPGELLGMNVGRPSPTPETRRYVEGLMAEIEAGRPKRQRSARRVAQHIQKLMPGGCKGAQQSLKYHL